MLVRAPSRLGHGVKQAFPQLTVTSSKGLSVNTECGRTLMDFSSGIGVCNLGHSHDGVVKAVVKAAQTLCHAQITITKHKPMMQVIDKLANLPNSVKNSLDSWVLWNSGTEAVEAAVKLAKQATGRPNMISMSLGYHGRTAMAASLTSSSAIYRSGFGPLPSGNFIAPFPYVSRGPYEDEAMASPSPVTGQYFGRAPTAIAARDVKRCLESIELMLRTQTSPAETAGIIVEPVIGEGGYIPPPPGFLSGLRTICDKHGILLLFDEIQTGFGRTGSLFASEWIDGGVRPDIIILAKGLANGFPLSAVGTRSDLSAKTLCGSQGGTYSANAVACAASLAVFDAFEDGSLLRNVKAREKQVREILTKFNRAHPGVIREVRGAGLMIGIELFNNSTGSFGSLAHKVVNECQKRDLIVLSCGPYDTLRLIPPLTITEAEAAKGMNILCEAIVAAAKGEGKGDIEVVPVMATFKPHVKSASTTA